MNRSLTQKYVHGHSGWIGISGQSNITASVYKSTSPWTRPHVVAQVTPNFGGVTTATYVIPVVNLRLLCGEANRQGITSQYSIEFWTHRMLLTWWSCFQVLLLIYTTENKPPIPPPMHFSILVTTIRTHEYLPHYIWSHSTRSPPNFTYLVRFQNHFNSPS